jgi:hypothetical protein
MRRCLVFLLASVVLASATTAHAAERRHRQRELARSAELSYRQTRRLHGTYRMSDLCRLRTDA